MNKPEKVPAASRKPASRLVTLGSLDDVLSSQASPEVKAACIELGLEAARLGKTPPADGEQR